jgi:hypothetical protein
MAIDDQVVAVGFDEEFAEFQIGKAGIHLDIHLAGAIEQDFNGDFRSVNGRHLPTMFSKVQRVTACPASNIKGASGPEL